MTTLDVMTEDQKGEVSEQILADNLGAILRRVAAGEDVIVTLPDGAEVDLSPHRRPIGLEEFLSWPKADRKMLDDIRETIAATTTRDDRDPWERWS